jgi:hypothetical protein
MALSSRNGGRAKRAALLELLEFLVIWRDGQKPEQKIWRFDFQREKIRNSEDYWSTA